MPGKPNRLIHTQSPYLLQHAYNPVDWYPWGQEAFQEARAQRKPILLSIGYSACHWCHVMAHESFEDEEIAELINAHFIPIKVDREEMPQIDHVYMSAATAMTGQGGWPLTVFLTSDGQPFYGGTYFPPFAKWGAPGFKDILMNIAQAWRNDPQGIMDSSASITEALCSRAEAKVSEDPSDAGQVLQLAFRHMSAQFDEQNGGFGSAPKFPMAHGLSFLLRYYQSTGEQKALRMAAKTLKAMACGGIRDHIGGGFHRYSTDASWHVPHFEKMLYDQALLGRAYTEMFQVTGEDLYARLAKEIYDYVLKDLRAEGGFFSARDADSFAQGGLHPQEGAFYVFGASEIREALGEQEAKGFNACYGVREEGNVTVDPHGEFRGKNILFLSDENAGQEEVFAPSRAKLSDLRGKRSKPFLDDKVLTDWNGLMVSSLSYAAGVFLDDRYLCAARQAADFILQQMCVGDRLLHRWYKGQAGVEGIVDDYAFMIQSLLDLYDAGLEERYLVKARGLAETMLRLFEDPQGAFFMTPVDGQQLIFRPKEIHDGAIPSGNSVAISGLLRLYALTQHLPFLACAQKAIQRVLPAVERAPLAYASFLMAVDLKRSGFCEIKLEGQRNESEFAKMRKVVYKHFVPSRVISWKEGTVARASVCARGACRPAVTDAQQLEQNILGVIANPEGVKQSF